MPFGADLWSERCADAASTAGSFALMSSCSGSCTRTGASTWNARCKASTPSLSACSNSGRASVRTATHDQWSTSPCATTARTLASSSAPSTLATLRAVSNGRSHDTITARSMPLLAATSSAVTMPRSGQAEPFAVSCTCRTPAGTFGRLGPPTYTRCRIPAPLSESSEQSSNVRVPNTAAALSLPKRVLAPPVSTAPSASSPLLSAAAFSRGPADHIG